MTLAAFTLASTMLLVAAAHAAEPSACGWDPVGSAAPMNGSILATAIFEDVGTPTLFAVGLFSDAWGTPARGIARWDGAAWTGGGDTLINDVRDVINWNQTIVAGGNFAWIDSLRVDRVACWDGQTWSPLGDGFDDVVNAFAVFDDGTGPTLYAAGAFRFSGDREIRNIASWSGVRWEPVGGGTDFAVFTLGVFDLGDGPALYAGGRFTQAGGQPARSIAKWDGQSWSPLGDGQGGWVNAMEVFDDGSGPALYAAGLRAAVGQPVTPLSRWDGASWTEVTNLRFAMPDFVQYPVRALRTFDDGTGPALYIGGQFTRVNNEIANALVRWDGLGWEPVGDGVTGPNPSRTVETLRVHDLGAGPGLYVGGHFVRAGGRMAQNLARWENWAVTCPADMMADCRLDFFDLYAFTLAFAAQEPSADFNRDGTANFFDFSEFVGAFNAGCER